LHEDVSDILRHLMPGCSFAPRCAWRLPAGTAKLPEPRFPEPGRMAACFAVSSSPV